MPAASPERRTRRLTSPFDGRDLGTISLADAVAVIATVAKAERAAAAWGETPIKDRVQPLYRFKALLENRLDEVAALASAESGKTLDEARAEVKKGIEVVEYACALPVELSGHQLEVSRGVDCATRHLPLGVVAGVTPFNFPAMVPLWMIPLALATGNAFIHKPSEQVPLTAHLLHDLLIEAGLPADVHQVLDGDRAAVEALLDAEAVRAVAFVGSTPVAKSVYQRGTANGKRVLALGGAKNHLVVLPDADVAMTAQGVVASAFGCAGQRCMAASVLVVVGESDHLVEAIQTEAAKIRLGTDMGALINAAAKERLHTAIATAEADGARIRLDGRGQVPEGCERGHWLGATIIDGLPAGHACLRDELFGPVLSIARVKTLDEAIRLENASPFGNAASLFTSSGAAAARFERQVRAGMVGINIGVPVPREPFGFGGTNASRFGAGDITGREGALFWTATRKVTRKWAARDAANWMS